MPERMEQHTLRVPGWPDPGVQSKTLTLALRLVRKYGDRVPSYKQIMHDFDVSRPTAYRWRAALLDAQRDGGNG